MKRRKVEQNLFLIPHNTYKKKEKFDLEICSQSYTKNHDVCENFAFLKIDLNNSNIYPVENGQLRLEDRWLVGIDKCIVPNVFSSWKKSDNPKRPSTGFVKLGLKFSQVETREIGVRFFENRLYSKFETITRLNEYLMQIWLNVCKLNSEGHNTVGLFFNSNILSVKRSNITGDVYILANGNKSVVSKNNWEIFKKLFNTFKKEEYSKLEIERVEVFISSELSEKLGNFPIPVEIRNFISDVDLTDYSNDGAISIRIAVFPPSRAIQTDISLKNIVNKPNKSPSSLNILINILPNINSNIVDTPIGRISLSKIAQIPLKSCDLMSALDYSPTKVLYHPLPINCVIDSLILAITNSEDGKLVNIEHNASFITLTFKPLKNRSI